MAFRGWLRKKENRAKITGGIKNAYAKTKETAGKVGRGRRDFARKMESERRSWANVLGPPQHARRPARRRAARTARPSGGFVIMNGIAYPVAHAPQKKRRVQRRPRQSNGLFDAPLFS